MKKIFYILTLIIITPCIQAQFAALLSNDGFIPLENDSAVLVPRENLRGTLQWQMSSDSITWTNIEANLSGDTLAFIPGSTGAYRLQITDGTCTPLYSDTFKIFSKTTTVSQYLSAGISVSDLFTAEVTVIDLVNAGVEINGLSGSYSDQDGNIFGWVGIGNQIWMSENLAAITFNDGTEIPLVTDGFFEWYDLTGPGYCWYDNDQAAYAETYGNIYNYYAVETEKLCPAFWHVPDSLEWDSLMTFLGGAYGAGGKLKEVGTDHWNSPNVEATDEVGFTALPGGFRSPDGSFWSLGVYGTWWTSWEYTETTVWTWLLDHNETTAFSSPENKNIGLSVRCIKD